MGARPLVLTPTNRKALSLRGMTESIQLRINAGLGAEKPICIYQLCEKLGLVVRFVPLDMEGMYQRDRQSRILLSPYRPVPRRAFNCAHELGHHVFGHGSTVDELYEQRSKEDRNQPNEVLVNAFAAFALMPTLGVRAAFASRGLNPKTATAKSVYAIACNFGVGYTTLVNHLAYGIEDITDSRAKELLKSSPKSIRTEMLGAESEESLVVADRHWTSGTLDLEVGAYVLLPRDVVIDDGLLTRCDRVGELALFQASSPGMRRACRPGSEWATFVRVSRKKYVGLAKYRHLEGNDDEDEDQE